VKLSEIMSFVEWLEPAMRAIEQGTDIPEPPQLSPGGISMWITGIRNLEDRRRTAEDALLNLESERRDREAYLGRLSQQLHSSIAEAKTAQAALQTLQREVAAYKDILAKVADLAEKVIGHEGQIRTAAGELLGKATNLERLARSSHELSDSLKSAMKQPPLT
jgi:chromosome segregation ATPase